MLININSNRFRKPCILTRLLQFHCHCKYLCNVKQLQYPDFLVLVYDENLFYFSTDALKKLVHLLPETVVGDLASQLLPKHVFFQAIESPSNHSCMLGPYLPTRPSSKSLHPHAKINVRPSHPQFGMFLHHNMLLDRVKVCIDL